ncbi:MAG: glycosyltransferase family 4 protein [Balneolales bacterium]|nr:glycosyltransferase family 4 protein [Balneolales bacterium]
MKILIVANVWPEPTTSAAGVHMMQLLGVLNKIRDAKILFACTAENSKHTSLDLPKLASVASIKVNSSSFDKLIYDFQPKVVLFDRFFAEEQFSSRVLSACPDALRVLNTEDLHFLRRNREQSAKKPGAENHFRAADSQTDLANSDTFKRELASILRCDLTLVTSEFEYELLSRKIGLSSQILHYHPVCEKFHQEKMISADQKSGLLFFGNFHHKPNKDAVNLLANYLLPEIRRRNKDIVLHIAGTYADSHIAGKLRKTEGIHYHGHLKEAELIEHIRSCRLVLAPLTFGAGIKGKVLKSIATGSPVICSPYAAEGIFEANTPLWQLCVGSDYDDFIRKTLHFLQDDTEWLRLLTESQELLQQKFSKTKADGDLMAKLTHVLSNLKEHRNGHFLGSVIWHQSLRSSDYMTRWIEEKNKR